MNWKTLTFCYLCPFGNSNFIFPIQMFLNLFGVHRRTADQTSQNVLRYSLHNSVNSLLSFYLKAGRYTHTHRCSPSRRVTASSYKNTISVVKMMSYLIAIALNNTIIVYSWFICIAGWTGILTFFSCVFYDCLKYVCTSYCWVEWIYNVCLPNSWVACMYGTMVITSEQH